MAPGKEIDPQDAGGVILEGIGGVIPEDALAYWRDRKPVTSKEFAKLNEAARARAFTVAGLARQDLLADLHASLLEAMKNGETFAQWKKRIPHILEEAGWTGARIETIFRTNVQTAYMAGRYKQMKEVSKSRPYWQYIAVDDDRTRPSHAVLNGMVFPVDHAFWMTNYPPNGFRCRCTVRSLSARQVEKMRLEVQTEIPHGLLYIHPVTGMETPIASVMPDKGFAVNPAVSWLEGLSQAA